MPEQNNLPHRQESQWHVERFFALSPDMLCVVGTDGYLKLVNPAFEKALGYTQAELLAQPLLTFVHPEDKTLSTNAIQQVTSENPSVYFENRLQRQDGSYQRFVWTASYNDEQVFYAVIREVSDQRLAVGSPFETLNNWLIDAPAGIIILQGLEHEITLVNALYEKISGHSQEQLVGRKLIEVFPELFEQGIGEIFKGIYESGKAFRSEEFYATFDHRGQGFLEEGYYNFVAQPVKNNSGQVTALFIHVYEVTEYVLARQKLQESEEHFRAIFNQSTVGNAETDLTGRFILVNERYCEMIGYSREELLQKGMQEITHPDDLPYNAELFERMTKDGTPFVIEKRYICKDGSIVWVRNSVSPLRDAMGNIRYALAVIFDITDIKATEQALLEHQREQAVAGERQRLARELHDSVTQTLFSAGVITEAIPRMLQAQPQKALAQLNNLSELIRGASSEMRTLLLELRPDRITHTGLAALLTQLAYGVQARKPMKVWLRVHGDKEEFLPPQVLMAFYRIAQESINNIIKHSEATQLTILIRRTETYMMLTVSDDGQGFDTRQVRPGFGLMTMHERADEAGADLAVRSVAGKGTRIRLFWQGEAEPRQISSGG